MRRIPGIVGLLLGTHGWRREHGALISSLEQRVLLSASALNVAIVGSTLLASVVTGAPAHGVETFSLENAGTAAESGVATLHVYASPDGALDDSAILIGSLSRGLSLAGGQSTSEKVTIKALPALAAGNYTLLAEVIDGQGNTAVSGAGPSLTVAAPFFAFSETLIKTTLASGSITGQKSSAVVELKITNHGNAASSGNTTIAIYASPDGTAADGTLIRSMTQRLVIKPGASKTVNVAIKALPAIPNGTYYLVGQVTDSQANVSSVASSATYALAAPIVSLTPSNGEFVKGKNGAATVSFLLTNNGNVPSSGITRITVDASANGSLPLETVVFGENLKVVLKPRQSRLIQIKLAATKAKLLDGAAGFAEATDAQGHEQSAAIEQVAPGLGTFKPVSNALLTNVSVGADGSVWGLDSAGHVFQYDSSSGQFAQISGSLTAITVGSAANVWGLSSSAVYHWDSSANAFDPVSGSLQQIATGADGDTWGIGAGGAVFHYVNGAFAAVAGDLTQIALGNSGSVYGIDANGSIQWFNPATGTFGQLTGATGFTQLSVGADGSLWAANGQGIASYYNLLTNTFIATSGNFVSVIDGAGPNVYARATGGNVFHFQPASKQWLQIPGNMISLAAGGNGSVWAVSSINQVYELTGQSTRAFQSFNNVGGSVSQLSIGIDGSAWGVSNGTVKYFDDLTQTFQTVSGTPSLTEVSVAVRGDVWGLDSNGAVYQYDPSMQTFKTVPGQLSLVEAAANGSVWGLDSSGAVFSYNASAQSFENIPGQLAALSLGSDGSVWGLDGQLQVYQYRYDLGMFVNAPGSLEQISVGSASNVWGIDAQQNVYSFDAGSQQWNKIPNIQLIEVQAADDASVWGVDASGNIYQWNPATQAFAHMGSGATEVLIGNDASVWALNAQTGQVMKWF